MVFGEPSDICADSVASPQDVRHLFTCNAHPPGLCIRGSMAESIRTLSYLDNMNFARLDDIPGRGKQQMVILVFSVNDMEKKGL